MNSLDAFFTGVVGDFSLDVNVRIPTTGVTALFGPSGCGKTTLLRCLAGLVHIPGGALCFNGDVWQDDARFVPPHKRPIGYVFQEANLFAHLSVRQNLLFGAKRAGRQVRGQDVPEEPVAFDELIELLGIEHLMNRAPQKLSGGERQRVAIGRALLSRPKLLLMDEPLSGLDRFNKDEILPYLEKLHARLSIPVVYVSHDLDEIERLADHMIMLDGGRAQAAGRLADLLVDLSLPLAGTKKAATVLEAEVGCFDADYGLSELMVSGVTLTAPGHLGDVGKRRRVLIAASDVSITRQEISNSTISNVLPARIADMKAIDHAQFNISLALGSDGNGDRILARVTRKSWDRLNLKLGEQVFAQLKTMAMLGGVYQGAQDSARVGQDVAMLVQRS